MANGSIEEGVEADAIDLGSRGGIRRKRDLSNGGGGIFLEGGETETSQYIDMDGDAFRDVADKGNTLWWCIQRFYGTDPKMNVNHVVPNFVGKGWNDRVSSIKSSKESREICINTHIMMGAPIRSGLGRILKMLATATTIGAAALP